LILLKILLNLLMLLALHRWGIESGVGIDYSLTQSNQSYTHVSAFIVANTTGYRICLQSFNTDKPRDKLKTRTAKILGKRWIRSLQSVGATTPKKEEVVTIQPIKEGARKAWESALLWDFSKL
jgi:hypothetical protein